MSGEVLRDEVPVSQEIGTSIIAGPPLQRSEDGLVESGSTLVDPGGLVIRVSS